MKTTRCLKALIILTSLLTLGRSYAGNPLELSNDPHYNDAGFFDIHICNWPERPNFFKVLFSSEKYEQVKSMDVYTPDNQLLVSLDKQKFRTLKRKNKPNKRVYILDIDIPEHASSGWYKLDIELNDGSMHHAQDYVVMTKLEKVSEMTPSGDEEEFDLPITLKWKPVPGSMYYQAFIRDAWTGKLVFKSKLISTPEVRVPDDKLEPGGYYSWSVHSRDANEHVLLGDFHMGSMSKTQYFSVTE